MDKELNFNISRNDMYIFILILIINLFMISYWTEIKNFFVPRTIVTVDLVQIIRAGQDKYKTKPEIEQFTKRINYMLTSYADRENVIILSKQVVIKGADDVTSEVSKQIFRVK